MTKMIRWLFIGCIFSSHLKFNSLLSNFLPYNYLITSLPIITVYIQVLCTFIRPSHCCLQYMTKFNRF